MDGKKESLCSWGQALSIWKKTLILLAVMMGVYATGEPWNEAVVIRAARRLMYVVAPDDTRVVEGFLHHAGRLSVLHDQIDAIYTPTFNSLVEQGMSRETADSLARYYVMSVVDTATLGEYIRLIDACNNVGDIYAQCRGPYGESLARVKKILVYLMSVAPALVAIGILSCIRWRKKRLNLRCDVGQPPEGAQPK